ncbi:SRSF7 family protein [Megaselia abdita]
MTRYPSDRKVYVGDLGNNARKNDLEYAFSAYGQLRCVWVARNPPGFAFVEFEDARDASDSVRGLDGRSVCGRRVRVELSTGRGQSGGGGGGGRGSERDSSRSGDRGRDRDRSSRGRPFHPDDKCYECGGRGHYARDCRRQSRRRRSRSRSHSRDNRTRSRTGSASASRSRSPRSRSRDSREDRKGSSHKDRRSRENGNENGGDHYASDDARSPKRISKDRESRSRSPQRDRDSRSHSRSN